MNFWCSECKKPIEGGTIIFVCRGYASEPVPDSHERLRAMHETCAGQIGMTVKYPVYVYSDGTVLPE